ncbi:MAG TPA: sugar phosphate nucleotidyltransferase, partial [Spirochaetales bacterium]|nr:sugar phosphate nucleotidyltransferase [Spirochaetales bacterium]
MLKLQGSSEELRSTDCTNLSYTPTEYIIRRRWNVPIACTPLLSRPSLSLTIVLGISGFYLIFISPDFKVGCNMEAMLILAGGTGTRLWPASTPERPKQFLTLGLPRSFLQMTVERSLAVNSKAEIVIVTGKSYQEGVEEEVRAYVQEGARITVLGEPRGRNTAPAILLGALYLRNRLSPSSRV